MSLSNDAILKSINIDRALGSAMLFGHRHRHPTPPFHIQIMDLWRSADPLVVIEALRKGAKTTLAEEFLLMEAAFGNFKYCLVFGETWTKACQRIEAIKHEVLQNAKLRQLFGDLKGPIWSSDRIILRNNVLIEAHGWEEEIRGYKHHDQRPDRAYLDDIETAERVRDTATVDANWQKIYMQLIPAMDEDGKVRMNGTPLADDCMIRRAAQSPDWVHGHFPICDRDPADPQAVSIWPESYPMDKVRKTHDQFERNGMLRAFNQEYMLIATGAQGKPFTEEMMHYEDVAPRTYSPRKLIMDPARTVDIKKSDQTGRVVVSRIGTKIYVHESGAEYWKPDAVVTNAFTISKAHDDAQVVIEKNSLDDWLLQPIRAYSMTTGQAIDLQTVNAPQDRDKVQFIMGLQPFFAAGDVVFIGGRAKHATLISQLLNFPTGKRDALNALAYAPRVFSGIPVYGDFSDANITKHSVPERQSQLLLGCNATGSETTAILIATSGRNITVLADWVSPLMPNDSIPDIAQLIRSVYPGRKVTAWVPAEQHDQVGRNPLVNALRAAGLSPNRGEHTAMSRAALSPSIRTTMGGRRMLLVDENARHVMQACTQGYNWPVKSDGTRSAEPERGPSRTLMGGLETLVAAVEQADNAIGYQTNSINSSGTKYLSALPQRHARH